MKSGSVGNFSAIAEISVPGRVVVFILTLASTGGLFGVSAAWLSGTEIDAVTRLLQDERQKTVELTGKVHALERELQACVTNRGS